MIMFFNFIYNSDNRTIQIKDIVIKLGYDLSGVAISDDKLIIQYTSKQKPQPENNVIAYNMSGKFLWNIKEILDKNLDHQINIHGIGIFFGAACRSTASEVASKVSTPSK